MGCAAFSGTPRGTDDVAPNHLVINDLNLDANG